MSDVFISYARPDRPKARILAEAFGRQNWLVFWDPQIPPGKMFDEVIEKELESAKCVVVLWSRKSVSSRWVLDEASEGAARSILIPALIEDVRIPLGFRRIQTVRLVEWEGSSNDPEYNSLLQAVAGLLGETVKPEAEEGSAAKAPAAKRSVKRPRKVSTKSKTEAGEAKLRLRLVDVYGQKIDDNVDISLKHTVASHSIRLRNINASKLITITNLYGGRYNIDIKPVRYHSVTRSLVLDNRGITNETFVLPVNRERVSAVEFPGFDTLARDLKQVLERSKIEELEEMSGESLYASLDDIRKAGLLNLYARMRATVFQDGKNAFSYVDSLRHLRQDSLLAVARTSLRKETQGAVSYRLFHTTPATLHIPPAGYSPLGSFKTLENYGNLQLTFFGKPRGRVMMMDARIDDAQGIQHVFQAVDHNSSLGQSHPYDIHEILVEYQKIDPGFRLVV